MVPTGGRPTAKERNTLVFRSNCRRAIYFSKELEKFRFGNGGKLLEIGSGFGGVAWAVAFLRNMEPFAIELDPEARLFQKSLGVQIVTRNDDDSNFRKAGGFDVVILSHVLEHVLHPEQLLAEAFSMVKPSGVVVIEVPHGHFVIDGELEHPFVYTRFSLSRLLRGFSSAITFRVHNGVENVVLPPKYLFALARPNGSQRRSSACFRTPPWFSLFLQRLMTALRGFGPLRGLNLRLARRLRKSVTLQEHDLFAALPRQIKEWLNE